MTMFCDDVEANEDDDGDVDDDEENRIRLPSVSGAWDDSEATTSGEDEKRRDENDSAHLRHVYQRSRHSGH